MKNKKLVIKPGDNFCFHMLLLCMFVMFFTFDMIAILTREVSAINTTLIAHAVVFCLFALIRIFYWGKYVIDDSYMSKYMGKKLVFKIKISDVEKIFIRKNKWYSFFRFVFFFMLESVPNGKGLTCISFVFKHCEKIKKVSGEHNYDISLKPDSYNEYFERCDVMSLAKCKKLCKKLNIEPIYVK